MNLKKWATILGMVGGCVYVLDRVIKIKAINDLLPLAMIGYDEKTA